MNKNIVYIYVMTDEEESVLKFLDDSSIWSALLCG